VTGSPARQPSLPDANAVILIDLRASATGSGATDPATIGEGTLEERQRALAATILKGHVAGQWRLIDIERVLVVDDADAFSDHAEAYQHLTHAPTFGRMLCLVVGNPKAAPSLAIPRTVDASRATVIWVGDPRGVGWRMGRSRTTQLAFNDADPDGTLTLAHLIEALSRHEVFDHVADALSGLPYRLGVAALLPWARWPDPPPAKPANPPSPEPLTAEAQGPEPALLAPSPPATPPPAPASVTPRPVTWYALGGALIVAAAALAVSLGTLGAGYLAAVVACAVAGILIILARFRKRPALADPPQVPAVPPAAIAPPVPRDQDGLPDPGEPEGPPEPPASPGVPDPGDILAYAAWLLSASADDESFRQLSSPEQLLMLSAEPRMARLVRFAPESARPFIGKPVSTNHVVAWTASGDIVVTIRLVPLKAGLLRIE
jgi:hypothetical protein